MENVVILGELFSWGHLAWVRLLGVGCLVAGRWGGCGERGDLLVPLGKRTITRLCKPQATAPGAMRHSSGSL